MLRRHVLMFVPLAVFCLRGALGADAPQSTAPARGRGILDVIVLDENSKPQIGRAHV